MVKGSVKGRSGRRAALRAAVLLGLSLFAAPAVATQLPQPVTPDDFQPFDEKRAALGRLLFYDPVLSGNRNISCGTCHNHSEFSADGLSLGIGEGGIGVGPERATGTGATRAERRMSRHTLALFNVGAKEFSKLFVDGRVSVDDVFGNGFNTPAEEWLPKGLTSVLAAQALFPMTSDVEMAGDPEENEIAGATNDRVDSVWPIVTARVRGVPAYLDLFKEAFDDVETMGDITIVHIGNAIGDFVASEWRAHDSPFDRYLAGDEAALSSEEKAGLDLFFGRAGCASCHSGKFQTDQAFHALALPQFGPGRTRRFNLGARDRGRINESDRVEDAYRFRTPSLRNVAKTAPYGHDGAYATLEGIIRHHADPLRALKQWDRSQVVLPPDPRFERTDFIIQEDRLEMARIASHVDIEPVDLDDADIAALVAFLGALTDEKSLKGRLGKPDRVPSGLAVD